MAEQMTAEEFVNRIQLGEDALRDRLIEDCLPDIQRTVRHAVRTMAIDDADALSIGLEVFNMAIDHYKPDSGVPFIRFAQLIMRNRLIDWFHRQEKFRQTVPFSAFDTAEGVGLADRVTDVRSSRIGEDLEIDEALALLEARLQPFGFDLDSMVQRFPKHRDTKLFCLQIAKVLADDKQLLQKTEESRRMPVSALADRCNVPVKKIDKNRAGIIFLALMLTSELQLIQSYLAAFEKEGNL